MTRQERRRIEREEEKRRNVVFNLSQAQIDKIKKETVRDTVDTVFGLVLTLPALVLKEKYWTKTYHKRLPLFIDEVIECYEKWQNDEIDLEELMVQLKEETGVKLIYGEKR